MRTTRRQFTIGSLVAAAAGPTPMLVQARSGKTIAVLFDGLRSRMPERLERRFIRPWEVA